MDKAIKKHFGKLAKTTKEKKLLKQELAVDKKLDKAVDQDKRRKNGKAK